MVVASLSLYIPFFYKGSFIHSSRTLKQYKDKDQNKEIEVLTPTSNRRLEVLH